MGMTEKIKLVLVKKNMPATELARLLGTSSQNLYNKFKRDNFSDKELQEIAKALDCEFIGSFKRNDTGEII